MDLQSVLEKSWANKNEKRLEVATDYSEVDKKIIGEAKPYEVGEGPMPPDLAAKKNAERAKKPHPILRTRYYSHQNKVLKQKLPKLLEDVDRNIRLIDFEQPRG